MRIFDASLSGSVWIADATETSGSTKLLVLDTDDSIKWQTGSGEGGGGDVTKVGTPLDNEIGVWTGDGTIEGGQDFTFTDGTDMTLQIIQAGGAGTSANIILESYNSLDTNAVSIAWIESNTSQGQSFESVTSWGFRYRLNGSTNKLVMETGNGSTIAPIYHLDRATSILDFQTTPTILGNNMFANGSDIVLDGPNGLFNFVVGSTAANKADSGGVVWNEVTGNDYGAAGSAGFRMYMNGSTNTFIFESGNGTTLAEIFNVDRDDQIIHFDQFPVTPSADPTSDYQVANKQYVDGLAGGGGDVTKVGTPVNNEVGVWTGDGTISGSGAVTWDDTSLTIIGNLSATAKSFEISHPSKDGYLLKHGSLEGPEHAVYYRGKSDDYTVMLPDYWKDLVDEETITVQLTPLGRYQELYVREVNTKRLIVNNKTDNEFPKFYFNIYAERKDIDKLEIEVKNESNI